MLLSPKKCLPKIYLAIFLIALTFSADSAAQTKKKSDAKKADAKKSANAKSSGKKKSDDEKTSAAKQKTSVKHEKKEKDKSQKIAQEKFDKNSKAKQFDLKKQADEKKRADSRRAEENRRQAIEEAERRAAAEERRQGILAEQRRRAQIAREAQARRIAFERGLRSETVENIANDDTDGEDLEVRRAAVNALGNHAGTILVMEAQTGKVLSIVNQKWAIRKSFKPCSTIKLVTAAAGINENVINEEGKINASRFPMNLDDALAYSNNSYFQRVGSSLGNARMISYAQMFGLGSPTGINAENETGGRLAVGNNNARIYSHGDDFEVTPLQLGVIVSALSNGGKIVVPRIPKTRIEKTNFRGAMRYRLNLPNNNYRNLLPGMIGAATYGTARRGIDSSLAVAGKTGSCIEGGSWVGLFASVAPVEDPKYAVVVITRGQSERGKYAAAIAGSVYKSLRNRLTEKGDKNLAKLPLELKPQPKVNAKTSAKIDVAEGEESEDNDVSKTVKPDALADSAKPKAIGKKGASQAELFPTVIVKVKKPSELTRPRIVRNK